MGNGKMFLRIVKHFAYSFSSITAAPPLPAVLLFYMYEGYFTPFL